MNIALIAHDSKKELMVQFCIAYCRVLSQHKLVATGTTGKLVSEATGLSIQRFLPGTHGGDQQIAARIACKRDRSAAVLPRPHLGKARTSPTSSTCCGCVTCTHPVATNIATAEVLIHGLERGDLTGATSSIPKSEQKKARWRFYAAAFFLPQKTHRTVTFDKFAKNS